MLDQLGVDILGEIASFLVSSRYLSHSFKLAWTALRLRHVKLRFCYDQTVPLKDMHSGRHAFIWDASHEERFPVAAHKSVDITARAHTVEEIEDLLKTLKTESLFTNLEYIYFNFDSNSRTTQQENKDKRDAGLANVEKWIYEEWLKPTLGTLQELVLKLAMGEHVCDITNCLQGVGQQYPLLRTLEFHDQYRFTLNGQEATGDFTNIVRLFPSLERLNIRVRLSSAFWKNLLGSFADAPNLTHILLDLHENIDAADLALLQKSLPLKTQWLDLTNCTISKAVFQVIEKMLETLTRLKFMSLHGILQADCDMENQFAPLLSKSASLNRFRISVTPAKYFQIKQPVEVFNTATAATQLTYLYLEMYFVEGGWSIDTSLIPPQLSSLDVILIEPKNFHVFNSTKSELDQAPNLKKLLLKVESVDLKGTDQGCPYLDLINSVVGFAPNLEKLDLCTEKSQLTNDVFCTGITQLKQLANLRELTINIRDNKPDFDQIPTFPEQVQILHLLFADTDITDTNFKTLLKTLSALPNLLELELFLKSSEQFTDAAVDIFLDWVNEKHNIRALSVNLERCTKEKKFSKEQTNKLVEAAKRENRPEHLALFDLKYTRIIERSKPPPTIVSKTEKTAEEPSSSTTTTDASKKMDTD